MVLFLDDAAVRDLVSMDDALASVRTALSARGAARAHNLGRRRTRVSGAGLNVMGGGLEGLALPSTGNTDWLGAKLSVTAEDKKKSWVLLFDGEGTLRCLMVGSRLGQLRTGAATGVSTELLARDDARVLACLGSGYQARSQVEAVIRVRDIGRVLLWSRTPQRAQAFARQLAGELDVGVEVQSAAAAAVRGADVVVSVTATASPIVRGADVRPDAHVVLAGSNSPRRREGDAALFATARRVYADDVEQAMEESGDLRMAVDEGALNWSDVGLLGAGEGGVAGPRRGAENDGPTVFCSQGIGIWDVSLASMILGRALERGVGVDLPIDGEPR